MVCPQNGTAVLKRVITLSFFFLLVLMNCGFRFFVVIPGSRFCSFVLFFVVDTYAAMVFTRVTSISLPYVLRVFSSVQTKKTKHAQYGAGK